MCSKCCMINVIIVIPIQQENPSRIGRRTAFHQPYNIGIKSDDVIAITIKNLDSSFNGENTSGETPTDTAIVVIRLAPIKNKIKNGNTFFIETVPPSAEPAFRIRKNASANVIGMIANVRVNFTVTALSSV